MSKNIQDLTPSPSDSISLAYMWLALSDAEEKAIIAQYHYVRMFITGIFFWGGEASILVSHPLHNLGVRTVSPFPESAPWHGTVLRNGALHLYVCHVLVRKSRTEPRRNSKFGGNIPLARVVTPVVFFWQKGQNQDQTGPPNFFEQATDYYWQEVCGRDVDDGF